MGREHPEGGPPQAHQLFAFHDLNLAGGGLFGFLAALAIAVIIISKIINTAVKDKAPKQAAVAAAPAPAPAPPWPA